MGDFHIYTLETKPDNESLTYHVSRMEDSFDYPFDEDKWYDHEQDMRDYSKNFPETIFMLKGELQYGDVYWVKYFQDGKMQKEEGRIVYDEFDETKLK